MNGPLHGLTRVVIKIGSTLLVDAASQELRHAWLGALADDIAALRASGTEVIVVSSGAIALGRNVLKLPRGKMRLEESQAAAAVGQIALAHAYEQAFSGRGFAAAQVLLTLNDTEERRRYLNARSTIATLLRLGAIPVINENDTVATSEIRYGDNDRLAARVASMVSADCLILLSDVDGLYTGDPETTPDAKHIGEVTAITPEIEAIAGATSSDYGSGGMITKIEAGRIALGAGVKMVITLGTPDHPVRRLDEGAPCTWFVADVSPKAARKRWIAGALEPCGTIEIDAGAARALQAGKSLLPAGVTAVHGRFLRGDAVIVRGPDGDDLARGLSNYDCEDAARIIGHKTGEIEARLGYRGRDEMIHRDDLVLTE